MQRFILFFILSLLLIIFTVFLYNSYILQKNYFKTVENQTENTVNNNPLSIYKSYSKEDYSNAISNGRVLVLFFTSNWCDLCIKQDMLNKDAFNNIKTEGIFGLSIHILDSETTTETDALAKKFDVTKENTFVFLDKRGAVNSKYVGELTEEQLKMNILKAGESK